MFHLPFDISDLCEFVRGVITALPSPVFAVSLSGFFIVFTIYLLRNMR